MKDEKSGSRFITWLQKILLETCYAKTCLLNQANNVMEPIPHYSTGKLLHVRCNSGAVLVIVISNY